MGVVPAMTPGGGVRNGVAPPPPSRRRTAISGGSMAEPTRKAVPCTSGGGRSDGLRRHGDMRVASGSGRRRQRLAAGDRRRGILSRWRTGTGTAAAAPPASPPVRLSAQ